jgi:hypothetical protein
MTKSSSSTSRVKSARDEKSVPLQERLGNLTKSVAKSGIKLITHVILGILCIQQCRIAQSGLLPTCVSTKPYTDKDIEMEQIHMDFLTTSDKGVDKSIKATYPIKENLAIYQDSTLLKTIREWTIGSQSNNMTYYFGSCMSAAALSYYSLHSNLYGFVNSWFPQWLIMYMSFTIIPLIFQVAGFWAFIVFVFSSLANWGLLLELSTVDEKNPTRKTWRYDTGIWTWPSSPFTILVLIIVLCALPLMAGAGIGLAILLGLSTLLTRTQLLYSKKGQIELAMSSKSEAEEDTTSDTVPSDPPASDLDVSDTTLDENEKIETKQMEQSGGSDPSEITPDNDPTKKLTPEEEKAAGENACLLSNKTTSKKKEKFTMINQIKLTFKVYRHIIMIIMTIYMLMDIYSTMGTQWLLSGIFAVIVMSYFTKVYHKYKISACDNFTEDLIGYTNSYRKCELIPGVPHVQEEVERSGFHIPTPDLANIAGAATGAGALTSLASSVGPALSESLPSVPNIEDEVKDMSGSATASTDAPTTVADSASVPKS